MIVNLTNYSDSRQFLANLRIFLTYLFVFLLTQFNNVAHSFDFDEGIDYKVINTSGSKSSNKLEVIEFFGYFCPHCKSFSPAIKKWEKSLPSNVKFSQLHVPFRDINHQRLFFALENINSEEKLHYKIFNAVQVQRLPLNNFLDILSWVEDQGIDEKIFEESWNSTKVKSDMNKASKLMKLYKIDGVPQIVVNGSYITSPAMVGGSHKRVLKLVNYLLKKKQ